MTDALDPRPLADYPVRMVSLTRWTDNDMYGHLNNAKYYELFDTAINTWIAEHTGGDFAAKRVIGVVAESSCRFHSEVSFPGSVTVGFRVDRRGSRSVTYHLALFSGSAPGEAAVPSASGRWVHVYMDRATKATTALPSELGAALDALT